MRDEGRTLNVELGTWNLPDNGADNGTSGNIVPGRRGVAGRARPRPPVATDPRAPRTALHGRKTALHDDRKALHDDRKSLRGDVGRTDDECPLPTADLFLPTAYCEGGWTAAALPGRCRRGL